MGASREPGACEDLPCRSVALCLVLSTLRVWRNAKHATARCPCKSDPKGRWHSSLVRILTATMGFVHRVDSAVVPPPLTLYVAPVLALAASEATRLYAMPSWVR